jgi:hypothetical protein
MLSLQTGGATDGLTLRTIVSEIPTDPAAVFVYLLLAGSILLIWVANHPRGGSGTGSPR